MIAARYGLPLLLIAFATHATAAGSWYFPPPGQTLAQQDVRAPAEVGMNPAVVTRLQGSGIAGVRWALWRHGRLVHVEGDFNLNDEVKSAVKAWLAMTVGAGIAQGKIPSISQRLSVWRPNLKGNDALATWWNAMTQSAGFDYPGCGDPHDYLPGQMWTYSDLNMHELNEALAEAYGRVDYTDQYDLVWRAAFFDAIGMQGWSSAPREDHVRLTLDLEDMGRLGLFALAHGSWNGRQIVPRAFVDDLERHQTTGMQVNYNGCNDGVVVLDPASFPEAPYGYCSWNNRRRDFFPGADSTWTWASGDGGFLILWNDRFGIVYAGVGAAKSPSSDGIPHIIEANITGPDPLADSVITPPPLAVARESDGLSFAELSPNPASDGITLRFHLPEVMHVLIDVFDPRGRLVAHIVDATMPAGPQAIPFTLRDRAGRRLPTGQYEVRLEAGGRTITHGLATVH